MIKLTKKRKASIRARAERGEHVDPVEVLALLDALSSDWLTVQLLQQVSKIVGKQPHESLDEACLRVMAKRSCP